MHTKWHILFGFVFSYLLIYFFNFSLLAGIIIFFSSVLIDADHYLRYLILKKDWNPIKFWNWSETQKEKWKKLSFRQKNQYKMPIFIFHGIEFFAIIIALSFLHPIFFWILLGIILHFILDFIEIIYLKNPLYMKFSQILNFTTKKKKSFD